LTGTLDGSHVAAGPAPAWWRSAVIYQVYLRSFADADGDGIGDLAGLRSRLPYIAGLGADAIWITPWYPSPMADGGYDVADSRAIDPRYGTLADAVDLVSEAHRLGLRVLVDLVPNHTSSEHPWFRAALAAEPGSPERARYLFRPGRGLGGDEPPNNWPSAFGGPAWTRVVERDGRAGEWYLHLFAPEQPDLDWSNPEVRADLLATLKFWFDLGIDGFRIDVAMALAKEPGLPDLQERDLVRSTTSHWAAETHPYIDGPGIHDLYRTWRAVADAGEPPRVFVGEIALVAPGRLARFLRPDELHTAFNFEFLKAPWSVPGLREAIDGTLAALAPVGAPATWVLENHDEPRVVTRYGWTETGWHDPGDMPDEEPNTALGLRRARAAALLLLALPGSAYIYQGQELGLDSVLDLPEALLQDPQWERSGHTVRGRDGCRVPLPWSGQVAPFGFAPPASTPWLPQPARWAALTVEAAAADPGSTLSLFRAALRLRRAQPGLGGDVFGWLGDDPDTLHFERAARFRCLVNLGAGRTLLPAGAEILLRSDTGEPDPGDRWVPPDVAAWYIAP
jgi:alpha-glucosidase